MLSERELSNALKKVRKHGFENVSSIHSFPVIKVPLNSVFCYFVVCMSKSVYNISFNLSIEEFLIFYRSTHGSFLSPNMSLINDAHQA